jgi:hypothetical protein
MTVAYMEIKEFRESGYLQEVNRLFFHPLGLALEVTVETDGSERLSGVWDYRADPEGMVFGEPPDAAKARFIATEREARRTARERLFERSSAEYPQSIGHMTDVQPVAGQRLTKP